MAHLRAGQERRLQGKVNMAAYFTALSYFTSETCSSQISYHSQNGLNFHINKSGRQDKRGRWIDSEKRKRKRERAR